MFFHEYALTPQVFQKEYCESDDERRMELLYFLKKLRHNGLIANINKNQWLRLVLEYRNDLSPMYREKLSKAFEYLQDHHRIVEHETILREHLSSEEEWLDVMEEEDRVKPYAAIVFTGKTEKPNEKTYTIDEIAESELIEDQRTGYELSHTKENIEAYIKDFLLYAKKLTIIDPYFTYNKRDDEALYMYAELFGKRRGNRYKNRKIIIHTFYNKNDRYHDPDSDAYQDHWISVCKRIYERYQYKVTINLWDDRSMHDRFMITNQGGISSGRGFGINDTLNSYWSLMDQHVLSEKLNYFNSNANPDLKLALSLTESSHYSASYNLPKRGKIHEIIHDNERGKAGFLMTEEGRRYYFTMPVTYYLCADIAVGKEVEFEEEETEKGKKAKVKKVFG